MKMKHTVQMKSGRQEIYEFKSKTESAKALENAVHLNKTFNSIKCIWIEPTNKPWQRKRIDF